MSAAPKAKSVQVSNEHEIYCADTDYTEMKCDADCCAAKIFRDGGKICFQFSSEWLWSLMETSSTSQVPFNYYGRYGTSTVDRSYPRADKTAIFIDGKERTGDDKHGGRKHSEATLSLQVPYLEINNETEESFALADLMIVYKRGFTKKVISELKKKHFFTYENRISNNSDLSSELYDYPLLCVYFPGVALGWMGADKQGYSRIAQIYFTAQVNHFLLAEGCAMEVVAREGFGAIFPSTSDLGNGFRFDPGFLPLKYVHVIVKVLSELSEFFTLVQSKKEKRFANVIKTLTGNDSENLKHVDKCIRTLSAESNEAQVAAQSSKVNTASASSKTTESTKKLTYDLWISLMCNPETKKEPAARENAGCYRISISAAEIKTEKKEKKLNNDEAGYDSASEDEFEDELKRTPILIRKATFISGMAAIQIVNDLANKYVHELNGNSPPRAQTLARSDGEQAATHAYYYFECMKLLEHVGVAHVNLAPNPRNTNHATFPVLGAQTVLTVDATNASLAEKTILIDKFIETCIANQDLLLILIESGSKHPTGGDIVFGVVRWIGTEKATTIFFRLLQEHLLEDKNWTSVLNKEEHDFRKALKVKHLTSRNRDIVAAYKESKTKQKNMVSASKKK